MIQIIVLYIFVRIMLYIVIKLETRMYTGTEMFHSNSENGMETGTELKS